MKKARSEEEFKVLEQEVQHLREENVTLKDTILILKQQLAQERLAKENSLRSFEKLQMEITDVKKNCMEMDVATMPSSGSGTQLPSKSTEQNFPKTLKKTRSRELLELKLSFEAPQYSRLVSSQKYALKKKQSTQSYPIHQQRTSNLLETPSQPCLLKLKTLKELRMESQIDDEPYGATILERKLASPRLSQTRSIDKALVH